MHEVWNQNPSNEDNLLTKKQQWKKSGWDQESVLFHPYSNKQLLKLLCSMNWEKPRSGALDAIVVTPVVTYVALNTESNRSKYNCKVWGFIQQTL